MIVTIIIFLAILTILVLVHELGHFVTARKFGIAVEEFGIGLPPRAIGLKRGKTIFSLNWIPLGGFVKIVGEDGTFETEIEIFEGTGEVVVVAKSRSGKETVVARKIKPELRQ